jgi:ABC-type glycerol-3-phosphate transport system substrate-binding protein
VVHRLKRRPRRRLKPPLPRPRPRQPKHRPQTGVTEAWSWCRRRAPILGDIRSDFITAAPTGSGPDIILGAHDWIGELNASGLLAPVELGPNAASFAPNAVQAFTFTDGKIYGMPQATENIA